MTTDNGSAQKPFTITRTFDAPRDLVWKAHTDCEHLKHWWGPKGFTMSSCKVDLRPGGTFLYGLESPDGLVMWGKFVYREIVEPEKLVFVVSFSDENAGITRHPASPTWPLEMLSTSTFTEQDGGTAVTVSWYPINASEEEIRTFDEGREGMKQGFAGTFDQLEDYLSQLKAR
jgi:uncharacterized protein YndB with AHSA1/START domain